MASKNNYYVTSPIGSDYEGVSEEAISRGISFSKRNHRMLSGKGEYENRFDGGSTGFKYLEDTLFSTKDVKFVESDLSMTDNGFIKSIKDREGCVYKVFKFDRSYNIRAFDFIITYTQLSDWQTKTYKAIPVRKQFRGSLLFTGCSIVRDPKTMEELPLKLYAKYESIGDSIGENLDIDGKIDTKGGPAITFTYTYDNDYIYLYVSSISPFRLIPTGDDEFKDVSYLENTGSLVGENKENIHVITNPETGVKKVVEYSRDKTMWCDLSIALRDQTTTHTNADSHCVPYNMITTDLSSDAYMLKSTNFIITPTNDGEQMVIGMAPDSDVGLEIAQDNKPIRFGSRLLSTDMDKVNDYIKKLIQKIKTASINIEKVPFTIKTIIRTRGKYNIKGEYFIDDKADSYGQIIIQDVGIYNAISDSFDITEYITDKNTLQTYNANTVGKYKKYINNASDYLSNISNGVVYPHVRKTTKLLEVLSNIEYENPNTLDVYSDVAYIRSPVTFEAVAAYAEFGPNDNINEDDKIVYICKDGKIRVCSFKDYNMDNAEIYDIFGEYLPSEIKNTTYVTKVDRAWTGDHYVYCVGTNNGIYALIEGITEGEISVEIKDAFIENTSNGEFSSGEKVVYLKSDNEYFYIGGDDGSIRIINIDNLASVIPTLHFAYGDSIKYAELISDDTILFISSLEACTYNLNSEKWNFEGDDYRLNAKFWNPYGTLKNPNIDLIIDENGWENVPVIQLGQFIYALGLRNDTSGYVPIYKRLNVTTGEVISLPEPQHDHRTYQPQLCKEGNLIYMVGGSLPDASDIEDPSLLKDLISIFDTSTNTWIEYSEFTLENNGERRSLVSPNFHPIVYKNKLYMIKPKISYLVYSEMTNFYTSNEKYDDNLYIVDLSTKTCTCVDFNNVYNIGNVVPVMAKDDKITFLAGVKNVTYNNELETYIFNGYDLYRIILNISDNTFEGSVQLLSSKELSANYSGNNANSARTDMFSQYSIAVEYDEAIIYCLECKAIVYARLDIEYAEIHLVHHSVEDYTYRPLITEGEYIAWNNYDITPGNVSLIHIGNYIAFLGGTASRVNGFLDLSTISWIPAPRFMERKTSNPGTAILTSKVNSLSLISNKNNIVNQISSCKIDNTVYLLAVKKTVSEYSAILYKYELDKPLSKITFVKDLSTFLVSQRYSNGFTNFTLTPLGKDVILFAPYIGCDGTRYYDIPFMLFNVFAYKLSTRHFAHVINDLPRENDMNGTIYALEGENKVIYTVKDGPSYTISLTDDGVEYNVSRVINYVGDLHVNYTAKQHNYIIPTVRRGKFALAAEPFMEAIVIHKFDTIDGTESVNKDSFLYTIDNSENYDDPQLCLNGNDLYLIKGSKSNTVRIDNVIHSNKTFSTEIIKLKFNEAAGLTAGTDNDRMHALLSVNSSGLYAPFVISRNNRIIVFGDPKVDITSTERNNVNIRLIPLESVITKSTFVDINTHVTLTGASKSSTNRYKPVMTTMHANGHELVLVFGGTASRETNITKTLDVYDTARHIWSKICDLPEFISHVSVKDNVILGGTTEVLRTGTQKPYTDRLEIVCNNYDTLSFEITTKHRPTADYPTYGKWTESEDKTFVIPTNEDDSPLDSPIIQINNSDNSVSTLDPIDSEIVYNGNYRVIGTFIVNSNLVAILFNKETCELSFWKNISNRWLKVNYITEPNHIDITEKAYVFKNSDETFTSILNGSSFEAKAILAYIDPSIINSKGVLVLYITVDNNGTISVTPKPESFAYIPGDDLSAVDSVEISKDGFTYYSKNNSIDGEVRRIFPNNNSLGFGCRRLEAKDSAPINTVITRAVSNNHIYTIYNDGSMSDIDLDKNEKVILNGNIQPMSASNINIFNSKIINNNMYVLFSTSTTDDENPTQEHVYYNIIKIPLDNISDNSIQTYEIENAFDSTLSPYFLKESNKLSFTVILGIVTNEESSILHYLTIDENFNVEYINLNLNLIVTGDIIFINEKLDFILKNNNDNIVNICSINGIVNVASIPTDIKFCRIDNNTVYGADSSGKVYEMNIKNCEIKSSGYSYSTVDFINEIPNNAIIRNSDIILFDKGYKYIHPSIIDFNHYCYDNIDIDHDINTSFDNKVVSIGINNEDENSYVIYTSEKTTHIVETRNVVVDSNDTPIENIPIGNKSTMFVDKISGTLHLYIVDPETGKIYNINAITGKTNISELGVSHIKHVNAIKLDSIKNTYLLHVNRNCYLYNTKDSTIDTKTFDIGENIKVNVILKVDPYFKNIRALFFDPNNSEYYTYGIFDGKHFDLKSSSLTDIPTEYDKIEYIFDNNIFISNDNHNVIQVGISDDGSSAEVLKYIPDYYKYFDTVADNPLIKFNGNIISDDALRPKQFKIGGAIFYEDYVVYKNKTYFNIFDGTIINVMKYKNLFLVITASDSIANNLVICDLDNNDFKTISSENVAYLGNDRKVICIPIEGYNDTLTNTTHFAQIISIDENNTDIKLLTINSYANNVVKLSTSDETLTLSDIDITDAINNLNVDLFNSTPVLSNSNTVTFYPKNNLYDVGTFVMSKTYGTPTMITESNIPTGNNFIIFKLADYTFIINKDSNICTILATGINGYRKLVSIDETNITFDLSDFEIEMFKRISTGVYYGSNDRICETDGIENIYFDPIKNVSEYYSRYIGVNELGTVYDTEVPISEYDISSLGIVPNNTLPENSPIRSDESNITVIPYIVYKSDNKNIVAHIPIASRLNSSKFIKDYDESDDLHTGEIYAFLPSALNGSLIRDDASYYRNENVVTIINNSIIKIKIDGESYLYSKSDNSIPLTGTILPIVMAYGSRQDNNGLNDYKYYVFIDDTGNVSTYDKELRSFVDIDGNVSVNVPFFSTQAMILPNVASKKNDSGMEVWAYSERNPYSDIEDKTTGFVSEFARKNNDILN